jgi:hypothetical protein
MENNKTVCRENHANLLELPKSLLNLSLQEIREKYTNHSICLIEYIEKDINEKTIEIRFDKEEVTLSGLFDSKGICIKSYLFPDKNELVENLIVYLAQTYDFDYMENKWTVQQHCHIKAQKLCRTEFELYLMFYN